MTSWHVLLGRQPANPEIPESTGDQRTTRFAALYEAEAARVYGFLLFRVQSHAAAEDLTAEVFLRLWEHYDRLRSPDAQTAWLFKTARNLAIDYHRRQHRHVSLDSVPPKLVILPDQLADHVAQNDDMRAVQHAIAGLVERDRDVLGLRFVAGLRNQDIAHTLGLREVHVAQIIHRALGRLRAQLDSSLRRLADNTHDEEDHA
jgi:RNA polymerase sigma factor (sigma-70 family)